MPDFKVIQVNTTIAGAASSVTLTEGTDYTLESGVVAEDCWVFISSPRLTGGGDTAGGGNQNPDYFTCWVSNHSNIATSLTINRATAAPANVDCRVALTIIQYIGPSGGANEFKVRGEGVIIPGGTSQTGDGTTITTIADKDKCLFNISGQGSFISTLELWNASLYTGDLVASGDDWIPRVTRGWAPALVLATRVSYQVIEFTGSNWRDVQRVEWTTTASTWDTTTSDVSATVSLPTTLLDLAKAFIAQAQYRVTSAEQGLDDCGDTQHLASTTTIRYRNRATSGTRTKVAWILENTQSGGASLNVQHEEWYDSDVTTPEEKTYTRSITAVADLDQAVCMGMTCSSDGSGVAYPRGSASVRLSSTTQVDWIVSDTGQEEWRTVDVVELPTAPTILTPSPVTVTLTSVAPTTSKVLTLTPTAVGMTLSSVTPTVARVLTLTPSPVALTLTPPAPSIAHLLTLTPSAVAVTLGTPAPTIVIPILLAPRAVTLTLSSVAPVVQKVYTLRPRWVILSLRLPSGTLQGTVLGADQATGRGHIEYPGVVAGNATQAGLAAGRIKMYASLPPSAPGQDRIIAPRALKLTLAPVAPSTEIVQPDIWLPVIVRSEAEFNAGEVGGFQNQIMQSGARCLGTPTTIHMLQDCAADWRSDDNGESWYHEAAIGSLVVASESCECDPIDPNRIVVIRNHGFDIFNTALDGIYRSIDGGKHWTHVLAKGTENNNRFEHNVAWDPTVVTLGHVQRWYAALPEPADPFKNLVLYLSQDGARTWSEVARIAPSSSEGTITYFVLCHPTDGTSVFWGTSDGLYKYDRATDTLTQAGLSGVITSLAFPPNDPYDLWAISGGNLYISINNGTTFSLIKDDWPALGVWINQTFRGSMWLTPATTVANDTVPLYTDDAGQTWTTGSGTVNTAAGLDRDTTFNKRFNQPFTFLLPDHNRADDCIVAAGARVYITLDGGNVWTEKTRMMNGSQWNFDDSISWDVGNPSRFMTFNVDVGPQITENGGDWFEDRIGGLLGLPVQGAGYPCRRGAFRPVSGTNNVVMTMGDTSGNQEKLLFSADAGVNWAISTLGGGDPGYQQDIRPVWTTKAPVTGAATTSAVWAGVNYSLDSGATLTAINWGGQAGLEPRVIAVSPSDHAVVWAISADERTVVRSTDSGATWSSYRTFGFPLSPSDDIPLLKPHPTDTTKFYSITSGKDIALYDASTTVNLAILDTATGEPGQTFFVNCFTVDPIDNTVLYAGIYGWGISNIYRSTDSGTTWVDISRNQPRMSMNGIALSPTGEAVFGGCVSMWIAKPPYVASTPLWEKQLANFNTYYPQPPVVS